jgi:hypothetical protein
LARKSFVSRWSTSRNTTGITVFRHGRKTLEFSLTTLIPRAYNMTNALTQFQNDRIVIPVNPKHKGKYFYCRFRRKVAKKINGIVIHPVGSIREMLCRYGVKKYSNATIASRQARHVQDNQCDVLTCWDVEVFHQARKTGMGLHQSGMCAFRRINLTQILEMRPV